MFRFIATSYLAIGVIEALNWPHPLVVPPVIAALVPWGRLVTALRRFPASS
ncbi:MAG TPA: hypothetical protein VIO14_13915 [Dehalococcoidia bacterium]